MNDSTELAIIIDRPIDEVKKLVAKPYLMPLWTGHQSIYKTLANTYQETRLYVTFNIDITENRISNKQFILTFNWSSKLSSYSVNINLIATSAYSAKVTFDIDTDKITLEKLAIFHAELRMLKSIIEEKDYPDKSHDQFLINQHHINLYQKKP